MNDHREHIFAVAYRMLGTIADAEDVVQDTWLRWLRRKSNEDVKSIRAFLTTTAARLSIDRLRVRRRERARYEGDWLPEPLVEIGPNPEEQTALVSSLSPAFMVVLETLTPVERAAFLLRDVFGSDYSEIADVIGKSEDNCRQLCSRARKRIRQAPRFVASTGTAENLAARFFAAAAAGDIDDLVSLLRDDIVAWSDHGGKAAAARNSIVGANNVARYLIGAAAKFASHTQPVFARINGVPGAVLYDGTRVHAVLFIEFAGERVGRIGVIRNPDKLSRVPPNQTP